MIRNRYHFMIAAVFVALVLATAVPAEAQRDYEPLFDKFNLKFLPCFPG